MSTVKVDTIEAAGAGPVAIPSLDKRMASAWVNFNGAGAVAIRDSHNVASITDNGVGDYRVNFTSPMASSSYAMSGFANFTTNASAAGLVSAGNDFSPSVTGVRIMTSNSTSAANMDSTNVSVLFFGGRA